eukprot:COSAG06_NODE_749_length_12615_cov_35.521333_12_plen_109_part_00
MTLEQARAIRREHWPDQQWNDLIGSVVLEIFGAAEVEEGTMNPTRLNSVNRMRWLCERTMRTDKRMDEIDTKMDEMAEHQKAMQAEIQANQELIMEQLRSMVSPKPDP